MAPARGGRSRVLVTTVGDIGHLGPMSAVMRALLARNVEVVCLLVGTNEETFDERARKSLDGIPFRIAPGGTAWNPASSKKLVDDPSFGKSLMEKVLQGGEAQSDFVRETLRELAPDLAIIDTFPRTYPTIVAVHASGVPYALSWANLGAVVPTRLRGQRAQLDESLGDYLRKHSIQVEPQTASPRSPLLNLVPTIPELVGDEGVLDGATLVGLPGARRDERAEAFDWSKRDEKLPLTYLSLGTNVYRQPKLFKCVFEATADLGVQVLASVIDLGDELGEPPAHVITAKYLPQLEVLQRASTFVTHGGYNSVAESILRGVPMLVIPLALDQPLQAHFVARAGFGVSLSPNDLTTEAVRGKLQTLMDPASEIRSRLAEIAARCAGQDSAVNSADHVCAILGSTK